MTGRTGFVMALGLLGFLMSVGCQGNRPEPKPSAPAKRVEHHPPDYWVKQLKSADVGERTAAAQQLALLAEPILAKYDRKLRAALKAETDPDAKAALERAVVMLPPK